MTRKVLNLYAGIGGNRKLWEDVDVVAIEMEPQIASIYQEHFPNDKVVVGDAHQYLLEHFNKFDFIWASPPCPTHSRIRKARHDQNPPIYPNLKLYEEILFCQGYVKCDWVIENVISWYEPLIKPYEVGGHYFWSNFMISKKRFESRGIGHKGETIETLQERRFSLDDAKCGYNDKKKMLRNCVEPDLGLYVFDAAFKQRQIDLESFAM